MKSYVVYVTSTGEITRSGRVQDELIDLIVPEAGEAVLEGTGSYTKNYVKAGELLAYSDVACAAKAVVLEYPAQWSNESFSWIDLRTPDQAVVDQWAEVRTLRDALLAATDWLPLRAMEQGIPLDPAVVVYRQALRDITQQPDPMAITWPELIEQ